jgi:hypothetical protein
VSISSSFSSLYITLLRRAKSVIFYYVLDCLSAKLYCQIEVNVHKFCLFIYMLHVVYIFLAGASRLSNPMILM